MTLALRFARVPLTVLAVWALSVAALPALMRRYVPFNLAGGVGSCVAPGVPAPRGVRVPPCDRPLADIYGVPLETLLLDAAVRSLALLAGAAVLALTVGTLVGLAAAAYRRRASGGAILGATAALAAVPVFFAGFLLQMAIIFAGLQAGRRILPVYGFGFDEHLVLPLVAVSLPAVAVTAQLVGARVGELLDSEFVTTAHAKGLWPGWIARVHLLPHVTPLLLESLGTGLRISVAGLPILEYLFLWNGIGFVGLRAIAAGDAAALTGSAVALATLFSLLSLLADLGHRRRA